MNADSAHSYGTELRAAVRPWRGARLELAGTWTEARFDDFVFERDAVDPVTGAAIRDPATGGIVRERDDFSGNRINYVPRALIVVGVSQVVPLSRGWSLLGTAHYTWNSGYFFGENNGAQQSGFSLVNARIGLERFRGGIYVFGRNLLDERYFKNAFDFRSEAIPAGSPGDPRTVGIEARLLF